MLLLIVLSVLLIVQFGGVSNGLQKDGWFNEYVSWLGKLDGLKVTPELWVLLSILGPTLLLALLEVFLFRTSLLLYFVFSVVILLFCLGRGEFGTILDRYFQACRNQDWQQALQCAQELDVNQKPAQVAAEDWVQLHVLMIKRASYRGFERLFAVFFWYLLLGLAGALLYRLAVLCRANRYQESHRPGSDLDMLEAQQQAADKLVWLLEWPAVRLMGMSFALTGNFVGCFQQWHECLWCVRRSSDEVMYTYVVGALTIAPEEVCEVQAGEREATLLQQLISRTLIFWLCVISVVYLFS